MQIYVTTYATFCICSEEVCKCPLHGLVVKHQNTNEVGRCNAEMRGGRCTRDVGHPGPHVDRDDDIWG